MNSDAPSPVIHAAHCDCAPCRACRDAFRDADAARREELAGRRSAFFERLSGPVYSRLGTPRKPMPGTVAAINARYGR